MSDSYKVRRAEAIYEHAEKTLTRIQGLVNSGAADVQSEEDARLAKELAVIDLEEARTEQDLRDQLLKQADNLLIEYMKQLGTPGGELQGAIMKWRSTYKGW